MLRGLGRSPFGPRAPFSGGPTPNPAESTAAAVESPLPGIPAPSSPPPQPARRSEPVKETDPAVEQYETLKRHIHIQLVDRLDMNRVSEMDPKTLRNEIRSIVEQLCDTENPLLNRNEASAWSTRSLTRPSVSARSRSCSRMTRSATS